MTEMPAAKRSDFVASGLRGFLIVGLAHSGKTEVRRIVDTSHRIHTTRRVRNWTRLAQMPDGRLGATDLDKCAAVVRSDETLSSSSIDVSAVLTSWRSLGQPTSGGLLALLQHEDAMGHGADMWCAQVNRMEHLIERILFELPGIKVIHTIRDPRSGLGVSRRSGIVGRRGWDVASWELSARVAVASRDRHPDRYMIVRWEDLVTSPQSVCESLGDFIDTELEVPETWAPTGKRIGRGVHGRRIGLEIAPLLDALGYDIVAPGIDSPVPDVIDLASYRIRSRLLRRKAGGRTR